MLYDFNSWKVSVCDRICNRTGNVLVSHGACVLIPENFIYIFFNQVLEFVINLVSGNLSGHVC